MGVLTFYLCGFVFSIHAYTLKPNTNVTVTEDTWNDGKDNQTHYLPSKLSPENMTEWKNISKKQESFTVIPTSSISEKNNGIQTKGFLEEARVSTDGIKKNISLPFNMTFNSNSSQRESEVYVPASLELKLSPSAVEVIGLSSTTREQHPEEQITRGVNRKSKPKKRTSSPANDPKAKNNKLSHSKRNKNSIKNHKAQKKAKTKAKLKKKKKKKTYFPYFKDNYCPPECACYGRVVQCSDKGVDKVPYGIPYNARYMLLMNNKIDMIQLDLLNEYLSLEFLVLSNNRLTDGSIEGAFEGMMKLKRLYINQNLLISIPTDLPATLEELSLNGNNISVMSKQSWSSCESLHILSLNNNSLSNDSIPAGIFGSLTNLRTLSINHNYLTDAPHRLPTNLRELYLSGNQIDRISDQLFADNSDLLFLDLGHNRLKNKGIDAISFRHMAKLENLNLERNFLTQVPKHIPRALKTLNLEGNRISSVSKSVFLKLANLEQLGLSKNKIAKVAAGAFKGLSALHLLDVSHNNLLEVPRQLPATLHSIALNYNQIRLIPLDSFCGHSFSQSNLVLVHLENNHIDMGEIDSHAFRCLRGFQIVHF
ncbi:asporin [Amia ocellicauda]|uniref:asporin n=1 Tax=Amia ocellicauda TaxID=2972642 RepID=UPI0034649277